MGISNMTTDKTAETATGFQGPDKSTGFENVKNIIAGKLHNVAETIDAKAADQGAQCGMARYGK